MKKEKKVERKFVIVDDLDQANNRRIISYIGLFDLSDIMMAQQESNILDVLWEKEYIPPSGPRLEWAVPDLKTGITKPFSYS